MQVGVANEEIVSVLLVDDDSKVLSLLERALASGSVRVRSVSTGAEALSLLATEAFDAVVSDIQMPGISGLKLLRAVREYDLDLPELCHGLGKAIIAEGVEREEERAVLLDCGCDFLQGFLFGRPRPSIGEHERELAARGAA